MPGEEARPTAPVPTAAPTLRDMDRHEAELEKHRRFAESIPQRAKRYAEDHHHDHRHPP